MLIQKIRLQDLKEAEYNPRVKLQKNDEAYKKLKASIQEFGIVDPIIVNKKNNTIVGGHQRLEILKDLGYEDVDCVIVDLNEKQEKRLNMALNKNSGYWDNDKLERLFSELQLTEEELYATGFSMDEVENLNMDLISDLLEDEYTSSNKDLSKFAITFNIPKEYEEKFVTHIKQNGKIKLVDALIKQVEEEE